MRLKNRRILITGAASGIGLATAQMFVHEGARVALLDWDEAGLQTATRLAAGGVTCVADLRDEAAVTAAVQRAGEGLGGLDGVVNAAGIVARATVADSDTQVWRRILDVNLTGPYLVCRAAIPWLSREERGTIVNVASGQALLPAAGNSAYAASKAGLVTLTRALAAELAPHVRVNAIAPGTIDTPMGRSAMQLEGEGAAERLAAVASAYALQRIGQPEEMAAAILFLTSWESSYVTGALLATDGGRTFH